ncbi:MAG: hypothetical protein HY516_02895, partial [Candidatus Aenigmarchaeota archaeon]|nr:hypothetical protein [Candidatus Aenigmarchaeota archaeon]
MKRKGIENLLNSFALIAWVAVLSAYFGYPVAADILPSAGVFSGYDSASPFSTLSSAASLDNVIRFNTYAAAGNCHYHDTDGTGYLETCNGASGDFVDGCSADLTTKKVYSCSSGNCVVGETVCGSETQCHVLGTGQPDCQVCEFTALKNANGPAGAVNAGSSFNINYDVLATSSTAAGGTQPYEHRALFDNDGTKLQYHWNDQPGCSWSTFTFSPTAPAAGGSYTYTIKSKATASSSEPSWIAPFDDTKTVSVTVNGPPSISLALKHATDDLSVVNKRIASGNSVKVTASATDDIDLASIQYTDISGSPNGAKTCTGVDTSCSETWTITPTAGDHTYDADAFDTGGLSGDAVDASVTVTDACASWTGATPSISTAQYVNYASCSFPGFTCDAGEEVHVTHSGKTEANNDILTVCGTQYSGSAWASTVKDCNAQSTGAITFTSDYSLDGAGISGGGGFVSLSKTCHSTDATPPETTDNSDTSWHNSDVVVTLTCTDNIGGVGCSKTYTCQDTSGPVDCSTFTEKTLISGQTTETMTQSGYVRYYSKDLNTNQETPIKQTNLVKIDKSKPTSAFTAAPTDGAWVNANGFAITALDDYGSGSDLAACKYNVCSDTSGVACNDWSVSNVAMDGTCSGTSATVTKTITVGLAGNCNDQGSTPKCQVQVYATDAAGNPSDIVIPTSARTYKVDYTAPSSSVTALSGTSAETFNVLWTSSDTGSSNVKCVNFQYNDNGGTWTDWTPYCASSAGTRTLPDAVITPVLEHTYCFRSKADDYAGNDEGYPAVADTCTKVVSLPSLLSPSPSGSDITELTPTLDWTDSTGANCYDVQIFEQGVGTPVVESYPTSSVYTVPSSTLLWQKTYEWRIWPSATSCTSFRSPTILWTFNTRMPAPTLVSPSDAGTTSTTPTLSWNAVSGANCYQVNVIKSSDLSVVVNNVKVGASPYVFGSALPQGIEYKWKIAASPSACGASPSFGPWSSQWKFTTGSACESAASPCVISAAPLVGTGEATANGEASVVSGSSTRYWKITMPSQYMCHSPTPGDNGMCDISSLSLAVGMKTVSGTPAFTNVKIGTAVDTSDVCTGSASCGNGVVPGDYYITARTTGAGSVYPEVKYAVSFCGVGSPAWNPDTVADADSVDVGGCTVTIKHLASDITDGGGRFRDLGLTNDNGFWWTTHPSVVGRQRTIEFDDASTGPCDMDLKFRNEWVVNGDGVTPNGITVFNMKLDKNADNKMSFGYKLESPNCVFTHVNTGTCFDDPGVAGNDCGNDPSISADKKSVTWIQNVAT